MYWQRGGGVIFACRRGLPAVPLPSGSIKIRIEIYSGVVEISRVTRQRSAELVRRDCQFGITSYVFFTNFLGRNNFWQQNLKKEKDEHTFQK